MPEEIKEEISKHNLWFLAWALKAYKQEMKKDEIKKAIYREVENHIKNMKELKEEKELEKFQSALYIASFFYRFEISVREGFLRIFMENPQYIVNKLRDIGEIITFKEDDGKDYIAMHHSEIAEIYFQSFLQSDALKTNANSVLSNKNTNIRISKDYSLQAEFITYYLKSYPDEFVKIFPWLGIIGEVSNTVIYNLYKRCELVEEICKNIKIEYLKDMEASELDRLIRANKLSVQNAVNKIEKKVFENKIKLCKNPGNIGYFIKLLKTSNYYELGNLLNSFNVEFFKTMIKYENLNDIAILVDGLNESDYEKLDELLNEIGNETFKEKIIDENDLWNLGSFIKTLQRVGYKKLKELLDDINAKVVEEKVKQKTFWASMVIFIDALNNGDYNLGKINKVVFEEKIKEWNDPYEVGPLINALEKANYPYIDELKKVAREKGFNV